MTHRSGPQGFSGLLSAALVPLLALIPLVAAGCGGGGDTSGPQPGGVPGEGILFLLPAAGAPAFFNPDTTVVATRGEDLRVDLFYAQAGDPTQPGDRFVRFELDPESLLRYPEDHPRQGATFETGDTISIRISVSTDTLLVKLEPAGLEFTPDARAELEMSYRQAEDDFDGDGDADPGAESAIRVWRQERPGGLWFQQSDFRQVDEELEEVRADLTITGVFGLGI